MKLLLLLFAVMLMVPRTVAQQGTYPEEGHGQERSTNNVSAVHRLVVERLRQLSGNGGTWGEWSPWTPCSRSCGGGISIQSRECLMNPGRQRVRAKRQASTSTGSRCVGLYKRFQLCNTEECPGGYQDFRWEQCASFNKTPFNRRFYTWAPYYDSPDSCALNCRAVGLSFYATLNQTVIDGTRCGNSDSNKICVAGRCMEIGCDNVLGSGNRFDSCGICGGDNSTCRIISGVFSRAKMPYGYNVIATLPSGASNITIQHIRPSTNYLALKHLEGDFFLNGNWGINSSGSYQAAGTTFYYQRPERFQGDMVTAIGPLQHAVNVMVFYQSTNPGIKYEYHLPMSPSRRRNWPVVVPGTPQRSHIRPDNPLNPLVPGGPASRTPPSGPVNDARSSNHYGNSVLANRRREEEEEEEKKKKRKERRGRKDGGKDKLKHEKRRKRYEWKVVGFSSCTETCGGGTQTTRVVCVKRKRGNEVPDKHCVDLPRPAEDTVRCNLRPCPAQWVPEPWGPCSVTCGLGVQTRHLTCKMRLSPDQYISAAEAACPATTSIPKAQVCELASCDSGPTWKVGEWGACSAQCGLGTRHRPVSCSTIQGPVAEHLCDREKKPSNQELCDMGSCATDTWFFSTWEERCSEECGDGVQRRRVHCSGDALDNQVTETSCDPEQRPATTRACTSDRGCGGKWFTGPWGDCSSECGPGRRSRAVVCVEWIRGRWKITSDVSKCKAAPKPETTEGCTKTCPPQWYTSEWSQCSASCGSGVQRREVKCLNEKQEPALDCTSAEKPDTRQPCNTQSCHQEQADESASNSSVRNEEPQKVPSSSGDSVNRKTTGNIVFPGADRGRPLEVTSPGVETVNASTRIYYEERSRNANAKLDGGDDHSSTSSDDEIDNRVSGIPPVVGDWRSGQDFDSISDRDSQYSESEGDTGDLAVDKDDEESPSDRSHISKGSRGRQPPSPVRPGRPWKPGLPTVSCIDRMKNCHLVYKARLCRLKYYNKLCCETCTKNQ
ncbi:thrombospondin type-1 domain-containing protein 4-like isoform X4 [Macrobrachium rosenbergii]